MDLQGKRYVDLKNAFRYRTELVKGCECNPMPGAETVQQSNPLREPGPGSDLEEAPERAEPVAEEADRTRTVMLDTQQAVPTEPTNQPTASQDQAPSLVFSATRTTQLGVWIAIALLLVYPFWKIFTRAGLKPYFALLVFIPYVGPALVLFMLAFQPWPTQAAAPETRHS